MPCAENEVLYPKIASLWPRGDDITISYSPALDLDICIPLEFVATLGQNSLGFVQELAQTLVLESGSLRRSEAPDVELDLTAPPSQHENFVFLPDTPGTLYTERRGPESTTRRKAPPVNEDGASSVSHSSRDSADQCRIRSASSSWRATATATSPRRPACHACRRISLHTRVSMVYEQLLDDPFQFDAKHGILLERTLHREYDNYEWSLYYKDNQYFFHCFNARKDFLLKHHGTSAKVADMRCLAPPSPDLCKWHYTQCVLKTVRGYSYGMAQNAI